MNGDAVFNVMIGAALGSAIAVCVVRRRWWAASAMAAVGIWGVLFALSHELGSPAAWRAIGFWVYPAVVAYYVAALVMVHKSRRGGKHPGEAGKDPAGQAH